MRLLLFLFLSFGAWANEGAKEGEKAKEEPKEHAAIMLEIPEEDETAFVEGPEVEIDREVKIPAWVVEQVQGIAKKFKEESHDPEHTIVRQNLNFKIYLKEKSEGILGGHNVVVKPSTGGGILDISKIVKAHRGTFYWHVQLRPRLRVDTHPTTKVYFVSHHVRQLREDGPAIGIGCGKVADISSYFSRVVAKAPGEKLNTTVGTNLGVLLGTFYFFVIDIDAIRVATLTVHDPRARAASCR